MSDKCNCYRFSPRDSLSGAVAQIADYLSKHPGWNETELRTFVDGLISSVGVETFNGRSGNVTLNKDDVNNLLIANCYFAEADETIESIDVLALYKLGIRIVFTQYSSEVGGYTLAYGIEYYPITDTAKAYLFSSGSGGGTGAIVSVNGKTGTVVLNASDILMNDGDTVEMAVSSAQSVAGRAATDATNALNKANAAYSADNAPPYPVTSVNGKTGSVTGLYDSDNQPPYPVTSVNGKTGSVTGLYDSDNQPPYPVTSVNGRTGSVTNIANADHNVDEYGDRISIYGPGSPIAINVFNDGRINIFAGGELPVAEIYSTSNKPPYPVASVDGKTGAVKTYNIITLDPLNPNPTFTITKGFNIVRLIRVIDAGRSLPAGNTSTRIATISSAYGVNILGLSLQNNARDAQCTAYMDGNNIGFVLTNHNGEGSTLSDIYCNALIYTDEDSITISF